MDLFSASHLLDIWERGSGLSPVQQALIVLKAAFPRASNDVLERLTVGQRDTLLLCIREHTFGPSMRGLADCPSCHECLEMTFEAHDLIALDTLRPDPETLEQPSPEMTFHLDSYEVTFRLPTSMDLKSLFPQTNLSESSLQLLHRCVLSVARGGRAVTMADLPPDVTTALIDHMDRADPAANLTIAAVCPACGHSWGIIFDIVSFFWGEINAWSMRLTREVHALATAYGWREADILTMSAWRRQRYLELIGT